MHVDAAHELLVRFERELGLTNSRGGSAIRDKETEKDKREQVGLLRNYSLFTFQHYLRFLLRVLLSFTEQELQRLKLVLAGVALRRWRHKSLGQVWAKWREELRKTRIVGKMVIRWANRLISRVWGAWEWIRMNQKRLLAIVDKCIGRWHHRAQSLAWERWCEQCDDSKRLRKRATKAAKLWKNNSMGKGWRSWELKVKVSKRLRALSSKALSNAWIL